MVCYGSRLSGFVASRTVTFDDAKYGVFTDSKPVTDFPIETLKVSSFALPMITLPATLPLAPQ